MCNTIRRQLFGVCVTVWLALVTGEEDGVRGGEVVRLDDSMVKSPQEVVADSTMLIPSKTIDIENPIPLMTYSDIHNIAFVHGGTKQKVGTRDACEFKCDEDKACKSYSYRAGDRKCITTKHDLLWSTQWNTYVKEVKMDDTGKDVPTGEWQTLESIGYIDDKAGDPKSGLMVRRTMAQGDCESLCKKLNRCSAYSYKSYDQTCILNDDGIIYDTDWKFYAKNPDVGKLDDSDEPTELGESQVGDDDKTKSTSKNAEAKSLYATYKKAADKVYEITKQQKKASDETNAVRSKLFEQMGGVTYEVDKLKDIHGSLINAHNQFESVINGDAQRAGDKIEAKMNAKGEEKYNADLEKLKKSQALQKASVDKVTKQASADTNKLVTKWEAEEAKRTGVKKPKNDVKKMQEAKAKNQKTGVKKAEKAAEARVEKDEAKIKETKAVSKAEEAKAVAAKAKAKAAKAVETKAEIEKKKKEAALKKKQALAKRAKANEKNEKAKVQEAKMKEKAAEVKANWPPKTVEDKESARVVQVEEDKATVAKQQAALEKAEADEKVKEAAVEEAEEEAHEAEEEEEVAEAAEEKSEAEVEKIKAVQKATDAGAKKAEAAKEADQAVAKDASVAVQDAEEAEAVASPEEQVTTEEPPENVAEEKEEAKEVEKEAAKEAEEKKDENVKLEMTEDQVNQLVKLAAAAKRDSQRDKLEKQLTYAKAEERQQEGRVFVDKAKAERAQIEKEAYKAHEAEKKAVFLQNKKRKIDNLLDTGLKSLSKKKIKMELQHVVAMKDYEVSKKKYDVLSHLSGSQAIRDPKPAVTREPKSHLLKRKTDDAFQTMQKAKAGLEKTEAALGEITKEMATEAKKKAREDKAELSKLQELNTAEKQARAARHKMEHHPDNVMERAYNTQMAKGIQDHINDELESQMDRAAMPASLDP